MANKSWRRSREWTLVELRDGTYRQWVTDGRIGIDPSTIPDLLEAGAETAATIEALFFEIPSEYRYTFKRHLDALRAVIEKATAE